jgi:hypothetical protein
MNADGRRFGVGFPPTSHQPDLSLFGMDRSEIREGRLARHQIFWDMVEMGRQLGAFPQRGTRAERLTRHLQRLTARRLRASR